MTDIIDLKPRLAIIAFKEMVRHKKDPHYDASEVLQQLRRNSLKDAADYLDILL